MMRRIQGTMSLREFLGWQAVRWFAWSGAALIGYGGWLLWR